MRLKQIKLAGFKSFVDPTKVPFEKQMTAIVGPNGCGKSNIIDAVRWVLGESSAKNLRGDAMTDVIFNGAASRKPIGQASVELTFEQSDNITNPALSQQLVDRSEISIRRVVNRESANTYYLNGSKCRRKDITDIFLGTGLGPRSYAIIEQGTISRLIESKPQELRVFIEEAAGISKYKERRRDTENRIKHTRENLERLFDIRHELGQQLEKLDQQAQAAKRYRKLKASERKYQAELAVLKWQKFTQQAEKQQQKIKNLQQQVEDFVLAQIASDSEITQITESVSSENEALQALQHEKVQLSQKAIRLEQNVKHANDRSTVISQELTKLRTKLTQLSEQYQLELGEQKQLEQSISNQSPMLSDSEQALAITKLEITQLTELQQNTQQAFTRSASDAKQQLVSKSKIEAQLQHCRAKHQELEQLVGSNDTSLLSHELDDKQQQLVELKSKFNDLESNASTKQLALSKYQTSLEQANQALQQAQAKQNQLNWQHDHLVSQHELLQTKLALADQTEFTSILSQKKIKTLGKLFELLVVEEKWQTSLEKVLGHFLVGTVIDEQDLTPEIIENLLSQQSQFTLVLKGNAQAKIEDQSLASAVKNISDYPFLASYLNEIRLCDTVKNAYDHMSANPSIKAFVCPDGSYITDGILDVGQVPEQTQLISETAQLAQINQDIEALLTSLDGHSEHISQLELNQQRDKDAVVALSAEYKGLQNQTSQVSQEAALLEQNIAHLVEQQQRNKEQQAQRQAQLLALTDEISELHFELDALEDNQVPDLHELEQQSSQAANDLAKKQQLLIEQQGRFHQYQVAIETANAKLKAAQLHQVRLQEQIHSLETQIQTLTFEQDNLSQPLGDDQGNLQQYQKQLLELEEKIIAQQQQLAGANERIEQTRSKGQQAQARISRCKDELNSHQIQRENYLLRAETVLEGLNEQQSVSEILKSMPSDAKESLWQANLARLAKDIAVLGAINLAAIEEFDSQLERKQYLDQQDEDLQKALKTLEEAIHKIDKESRAKFKTTFDQVNHDLQSLFPKVFGGGSAYLDLTGDDLLETGVTIMARPPGKKNSTIHLLSGGEKALTALSLVFAIFRLNPAPFCMLDEVDAPLDDANVGRFCNLVREMSQTVQFIYISHNKIAMEMASQLTGVTMYEPGVSRMVAVDIDEAVAMAELS